MKKRVAKNSRIAFARSNFAPQEWVVYRAILRAKKTTRQRLVAQTGLQINCVSGRVAALLDRRLIEVCGTEINRFTRMPNALLQVRSVARKAG